MPQIRILLVDDHLIVRSGLRRLLETCGYVEVVGEAANGEEAVAMADLAEPDVTFMDIRMPGMSGVEAIRKLKERHPQMNIIVLTLYGDQYLASAIEAGATGYLLKDISREDILEAIEAVHRGQSVLDPSLSRGLFSEFATLAKGRNGHKVGVSERERQVLELIAEGATNKEIAGRLFLSETTVKREVRLIFDKLEVRDRAEAVSVSLKRGLI